MKKRIVSIVVSLVVLGAIYWQIDAAELVRTFQHVQAGWMAVSLGMVAPLAMLTAWRLRMLMPEGSALRFGEATRLILAASTLNMVLPSKMGDVAKAYFMKERGHLSGSLALSLVVFEKASDLLALLLWCLFGLVLVAGEAWAFGVAALSVAAAFAFLFTLLASRAFARWSFAQARRLLPKRVSGRLGALAEAWGRMQAHFWNDKTQAAKVGSLSVFIWFLHLLQIWLFILALRAWAPFLASLALAPLALLAGLLPLTFAGVGTRDAALIVLFEPYLDAPTAAALGLLCTLRYLLLALGGLPFLNRYSAASLTLTDAQEA